MKKILYFLIFCVIIDILVGFVYFFAWISPQIKIYKSNDISMYDVNDNLVFTNHYDYLGEYVELEKMSVYLPLAFISSEDENFYEHYGFDLKGFLRAIYNNTFKGTTQGGSTISQQLARSLFLNNDKSLTRKIKEAFLAMRLEMSYEKDFILEQYLNNIYLGHNLYGVSVASSYYFNKNCKDLTLDEAALLAGIANAPNINAPDINYNNALKRKNYVLKKMYELKYIDYQTFQENLVKEPLIDINLKASSCYTPYYREVKKQLIDLNLYTKENLAKGLNVYTNMDQDITYQVYNIIKNNQLADNSEIAVSILKPYTNKILCVFGGYNLDDEFNRASMAKRQTGSAIKPLIYYLALQYGFSPLTTFISEETTFYIKDYGEYSPKNSNNQYANGPINMIEAIAVSDNIYATKTTLFIGSNNLVNLLSNFDVEAKAVPSAGLGVNEISLLDLVSIYNTFASEGMHYKPSYIRKVVDKYGNVLYSESTKKKKILNQETTLMLNQLLTATFDPNAKGYATPTLLNYKPRVNFAAKTGSTSSDSLTIGFNPNYTIGIWRGMDDNSSLTSYNLSKKLFLEIANLVTKNDSENIWYARPNSLIAKRINPLTGKEDNDAQVYWLKR